MFIGSFQGRCCGIFVVLGKNDFLMTYDHIKIDKAKNVFFVRFLVHFDHEAESRKISSKHIS